MRALPKDEVGYESGGWRIADSPAGLATKPAQRRNGPWIVKWAAIVTALAASYLLYYYYLPVVR